MNGQAAVDNAIVAGFVVGAKVKLAHDHDKEVGTIIDLRPFLSGDPINNPPFTIEVEWRRGKFGYRQRELRLV